MTDPRLILVDGSGFIFRAFHALPFMQAPDGTPVNAVYGFTSMLIRTLKTYPHVPIAIIFDVSRKTFRSHLYPDYKAQRPPPPDDLIPQFSLVRDATRAFGLPALELDGWEADDIIATYAHTLAEAKQNCLIISSDKDLMQLVGPHVHMLDPIKQRIIGDAEVEKKFGVPPKQVPDVQALMGDSTDNVPGVPGIGPKTASQLINSYSNLQDVLDAAPSMKKSKRRDVLINYKQQAEISLKLVTLATDVPLPLSPEKMTQPCPDKQQRQQWLQHMGFTSLLNRLTSPQENTHAPVPTKQEEPNSPNSRTTEAPYEDYGICTQLSEIEQLFKKLSLRGLCALTIAVHPGDQKIYGLSIALAAGNACYIPLSAPSLTSPSAITLDTLRPLLNQLLANASILKIFHDAKHALQILDHVGFSLDEVHALDDTMLMSYSQSAGRYKHDLLTLANHYLGHVPSLPEQLTTTKRAKDFFRTSVDNIAHNFSEASDCILRLWHLLRGQLRQNKALSLYIQTERPLTKILARMEKEGITIDTKELHKLSAFFEEKMRELEHLIHEEAGRVFNVGSPRQLGEILFDVLQLKGGKKTKSGAWRTDSNILENLAGAGHSLPGNVLLWRKYAKLKSTYTDALAKQADAHQRLHTTFQMAITSTGRLSSTDPNLQNIPVRSQEGEAIRRCFIAREGFQLISADYSQIELRLLAHVAHIPTLKDAFLHGKDIHTQTASEIFNIDPHHMDPMIRRRAKAINFGIIYGISAFGLSQQLAISQHEAKDIITRYFARFPGIRDYMHATIEQAKQNGYVTTPFGRRCYVPQITAHNKMVRQYTERQAINAPLQGGGADIIKKAMVKLSDVLKDKKYRNTSLLLQVHDELILEAPTQDASNVARIVKDIMENVVQISVPLDVDTGIAPNWDKAH